ncbi:hypothetical protein San01_34830 [Streptomyces angustmyceticus]|uniref:Uncharacterized protein n=1 Tax=Streptomyces angustmyceticus TaxID=285578 RepID=A0A5J4LHH9_9ACTN|nr:hypothetical protein San01_34830 [Streptomyces angustmyceticus]
MPEVLDRQRSRAGSAAHAVRGRSTVAGLLFWTVKPCLLATGRFTRAIQLPNDAVAVTQRDLGTANGGHSFHSTVLLPVPWQSPDSGSGKHADPPTRSRQDGGRINADHRQQTTLQADGLRSYDFRHAGQLSELTIPRFVWPSHRWHPGPRERPGTRGVAGNRGPGPGWSQPAR